MENRSKFYGKGKWANHTIEERYEKICWALDAYRDGFLDDVELDFIQEYAKFENPSNVENNNDNNDNTSNNGSYQIRESKMNSKSYSDDRNELDNSSIIGKEDFMDSTTDFSAKKDEKPPF